jgi:2-hydroxychromene-2-carboxylate isomerase
MHKVTHMHTLEMFLDCSSPWTYLGFESLQQVLQQTQADVHYRPFLVGGVFNTVNPSVYQNREKPVPAKARYYNKDLQDWARYVGIRIGSPSVFPVNSVKVMRGAFFAEEQGALVPYLRAFFAAYWTDLKDISQLEVIAPIVHSLGLDTGAYLRAIDSAAYKDRLRANTDELIQRGGFGSPTFFVDTTDMYFGNDRLPLIEAQLQG